MNRAARRAARRATAAWEMGWSIELRAEGCHVMLGTEPGCVGEERAARSLAALARAVALDGARRGWWVLPETLRGPPAGLALDWSEGTLGGEVLRIARGGGRYVGLVGDLAVCGALLVKGWEGLRARSCRPSRGAVGGAYSARLRGAA